MAPTYPASIVYSPLPGLRRAWCALMTGLVAAAERERLLGRLASKISGIEWRLRTASKGTFLVCATQIVERLLAGDALAPQAALACELGVDRKTVGAVVRELFAQGVLIGVKRGAQRMATELDLAGLRTWLDYADCGENGTRDGEKFPTRTSLLARGGSTSSSSAPASSRASASTPVNAAAARLEYQQMLTAVQAAVLHLPPTAKSHIWGWVGVYPVHEVQKACTTAALSGGRSIRYIERIIESSRPEWSAAEETDLFGEIEEHLRGTGGDE